MRKKIVGIMGPANPDNVEILDLAYELGSKIAKNGWILLTGGRNAGVMEQASKGASEAGGLVIGILPGANTDNCSQYVDIAIPTAMGSARNNINILASDIVVAISMGAGTASEVALALKAEKPLLLFRASNEAKAFFDQVASKPLVSCQTSDQVIDNLKSYLI